jgi:hypothetical protein
VTRHLAQDDCSVKLKTTLETNDTPLLRRCLHTAEL